MFTFTESTSSSPQTLISDFPCCSLLIFGWPLVNWASPGCPGCPCSLLAAKSFIEKNSSEINKYPFNCSSQPIMKGQWWHTAVFCSTLSLIFLANPFNSLSVLDCLISHYVVSPNTTVQLAAVSDNCTQYTYQEPIWFLGWIAWTSIWGAHK